MNGVIGRLEKFQNGVDEIWEWGRIWGWTPLPIMGRRGTLKWPALKLQRKYNKVRVFYNTFSENQGNFLKTLNIFENSSYLFIYLFIFFFFLFFFFFCIFYVRKKERKWYVLIRYIFFIFQNYRAYHIICYRLLFQIIDK